MSEKINNVVEALTLEGLIPPLTIKVNLNQAGDEFQSQVVTAPSEMAGHITGIMDAIKIVPHWLQLSIMRKLFVASNNHPNPLIDYPTEFNVQKISLVNPVAKKGWIGNLIPRPNQTEVGDHHQNPNIITESGLHEFKLGDVTIQANVKLPEDGSLAALFMYHAYNPNRE